jgi:hypothetical protein
MIDDRSAADSATNHDVGEDDRAPDAWQDDRFLVVRRGANLSDRCLRCGQDVTGKALERKVTFLPALWYLALLPGLLPFLLVELLFAERSTIRFGLCARHRSLRRKIILGYWIVGSSGAGFLLYSFVAEHPLSFFIGAAVLLALFLFWGFIARFVVGRIDRDFVWLRLDLLDFLLALPTEKRMR